MGRNLLERLRLSFANRTVGRASSILASHHPGLHRKLTWGPGREKTHFGLWLSNCPMLLCSLFGRVGGRCLLPGPGCSVPSLRMHGNEAWKGEVVIAAHIRVCITLGLQEASPPLAVGQPYDQDRGEPFPRVQHDLMIDLMSLAGWTTDAVGVFDPSSELLVSPI